MADAPREQQGTNVPPSVIDRLIQGVKYAISGVTPSTWMSPMQPQAPAAPPETKGRQLDFPVGYNLRQTPREGERVGFGTLRALADGYDLLRLAIETRKDQIEAYEWEIVVRDEIVKKRRAEVQKKQKELDAQDKAAKFKEQQAQMAATAQETPAVIAAKALLKAKFGEPDSKSPVPVDQQVATIPDGKPKEDAADMFAAEEAAEQDAIDAAVQFFQQPDDEHTWSQWLRMLIEDILVIDAAAIYPRMTKGGDLYSLDLIDPGTIKRIIDEEGRTPMAPDPAYQQQLKGIPAVNFSRDELLYTMRNPRTWKLYGYSPVEQVIMTVNIALRRQVSQLQFYTEGNIPEAIAQVPEGWTMDQIKEFQLWWDSVLEGNSALKRHMKFIPKLDGIVFPKLEVVKDEMDEWLARIVCYAFSIAPSALVKQVNRASSEQIAKTAKEEGLMPLLHYLAAVFTILLRRYLGQPDLEFKWKLDAHLDAKEQADVDKIYVDAKVDTVDEIRARRGKPPLSVEQRAALAPPAPPNPFGGGPSQNGGVDGNKPPFPPKKDEEAIKVVVNQGDTFVRVMNDGTTLTKTAATEVLK